ncbi:MAG: hypothetical protein WBR29_01745 [Gammaproteobacteria bacterium]
MTLSEYAISLVISLGLSIALLAFIFIRLGQGRRFSGWDMLAFMGLPCALCIAVGMMAFGSDAPRFYTRTLGTSQEPKVEGVTYLTGFLGRTNRVRVDTAQGVYLLDSDARVPRLG